MSAWQPHGSYGYPNHLALQSGSFYPPFLLIGVFGITYSHVIAAQIQSLHVLFGAVGMFFMTRAKGLPIVVSLLAGTIFQFSAAFYSNAQHCDIVRGTSYIPWIFLMLNSSFAMRNNAYVPLGAFLFLCFLTGSYPGIIVATIYCALVYFLAQNVMLKTWGSRFRYSRQLCYAACIAGLIVCIKYLPAAFLLGELQPVPASHNYSRAMLEHLATVFFDFHSKQIPYDISMRSLYLSPVILVGLLFINLRTIKANVDVMAVLVFAIIMMTLNPFSDALIALLPGMGSSRFLLSDYRGIFHVMSILLLLGGIKDDASPSGSSIWLRLFIAYAVLSCLAVYAFKLEAAGPSHYLIPMLSAPLVIVMASLKFSKEKITLSITRIGVMAVILCTLTGILYWKNTRVWQYPNFYEEAKKRWGFDFRQFYAQRGSEVRSEPPASRPERVSYSHHHDFGIRGYYKGEYTDLAYDAGRRLRRNLRLLDLARTNPELKAFLNTSSRCVTMALHPGDKHETGISLLEQARQDGVFVEFLAFREGGTRFFVRTAAPVLLVENEIFFPGWEAALTPVWLGPDDKRIRVWAQEGPWGLRAWPIPPGDFFVDTFFTPPYLWLSRILSGIGIFLFFLSLTYAIKRFRLARQSRVNIIMDHVASVGHIRLNSLQNRGRGAT